MPIKKRLPINYNSLQIMRTMLYNTTVVAAIDPCNVVITNTYECKSFKAKLA